MAMRGTQVSGGCGHRPSKGHDPTDQAIGVKSGEVHTSHDGVAIPVPADKCEPSIAVMLVDATVDGYSCARVGGEELPDPRRQFLTASSPPEAVDVLTVGGEATLKQLVPLYLVSLVPRNYIAT